MNTEGEGTRLEEGRGTLEPQKKSQDVVPAEFVSIEAGFGSLGPFDAGYHRRYPGRERRNKKGELLERVPTKKVVDLGDGRVVQYIPTAEFGYSNTLDEDYYYAFERIFEEDLAEERITFAESWVEYPREAEQRTELRLRVKLNGPVRVSNSRILKYAGRIKAGDDWKTVREWIKRQAYTGILGQLRLAKPDLLPEEFKVEPLFKSFWFPGEKIAGDRVAETNYVLPADWFVWNKYHHHTKPLDLAFRRSLEKPIARALYPVLDRGWFAANRVPLKTVRDSGSFNWSVFRGGAESFSKRYDAFCALFSLPVFKYLSRVRQQFDPALEELQAGGFLDRWTWAKTSDEVSYVLTAWPGDKWFQDQQARTQRQKTAQMIPPPPSTLRADPVSPSMGQKAEFRSRGEAVVEEIVAYIRAPENAAYYWKTFHEFGEDRTRAFLRDVKDDAAAGRIKIDAKRYFTYLVEEARRLKREAQEPKPTFISSSSPSPAINLLAPPATPAIQGEPSGEAHLAVAGEPEVPPENAGETLPSGRGDVLGGS